MNYSNDCKEVKSEVTITWLVEHNAEFYCSYCGYVFDKLPQLPGRCPKCKKRLTKICMPILEPRQRIRL
jgi:predicted Zn-ribbon and HTH transcriptional regulator